MRRLTLTVIACLLFSACVQAQEKKEMDTKVQQLVARTLKNMVFVEGGSYMMGDQKNTHIDVFGNEVYNSYYPGPDFEDARPAHKVALDSFYMGKFEVTYEEHDIFTATTDREPTRKRDIGRERRAPINPAGVSWYGAKDYCQWLGEQTGLPFDLPTEAQWEYAARSRGGLVPFATDTGYIDRGRNYPPSLDYPMAVGQFPPNPLGLHDMSGNAYEWVKDWHDPDYYTRSPERNPQGPEKGEKKVVRGGGVHNSPGGSSTVIREGSTYYKDESYVTSFRCVINTDQPLPVGP